MILDAPAIDYMYDTESYPNFWCCTQVHIKTGTRWIYEVSDRINQSIDFIAMLHALHNDDARMVGFNNIGYDYPIIHCALDLFSKQGYFTADQLYTKSQQIIQGGDRFGHIIWDSDRFVRQLDLYRIHHFDNVAKSTSLKVLEFNMRSPSIEDLPFDPNYPLTSAQQMDTVINYNVHDVKEQTRFYGYTLHMIRTREDLSAKLGKDFTNFNDTKIGKKYFEMQLEAAAPGICYHKVNGKREPRQTFRSVIPVAPLIFPHVWFLTDELNRVLNYLRSVTLTNTKAPPELDKLSATIRGFKFVFGAGGGHGSVEKTIVREDDNHEIIDVDVAGYYPSIAIVNRIYPEHLSELFCDIYADLRAQRAKLDKKSAESGMLKLAQNGVYGDSNNVHSCFLDPAYTMTVTINGQLQLCMFAEWLLLHDGIELIQLNTDGVTARVRKDALPYFDQVYQSWQAHTGYELERVNYSAMFVRDVNNYMAVKSKDGSVKRIGAYAYETQAENPGTRELWWNKDWSARVVKKAVEAVLVRGADLETFINQHDDPFDFMIRKRVNRSSKLHLQFGDPEPYINAAGVVVMTEPPIEPLQSTVRYHIATPGASLIKRMPQTARTRAAKPDAPQWRVTRLNKGWHVNVCNRQEQFDWNRLDRRWYVAEAQKLLKMEVSEELEE